MTNTIEGIRAINTNTMTTAQAEMFMLYELANFDKATAAVNQKLWAVNKDHQAHKITAPFKENEVVRNCSKTQSRETRRQSPRCQSQTGKWRQCVTLWI